MSTIGLIGGTIARLAVAAGHDVVLSNRRGPQSLAALVAELGPQARVATSAEVAAAGDIVVVTIPLHAYRAVPVEPLRGKVVIDTDNYYPQRDGRIAELDDETTTSNELLQAHLPESRVVKAMNNIFSVHLGSLARPTGHPQRSALAIASANLDAEQSVTAFLGSIGYDALDAGPLAEGWRFQRDTAVYSEPYFSAGHGLTATAQGAGPGPGPPVTADTLRPLLAAAQRYRDM
ncbi:NAD(P)-binding domain-containing protein [Streptomyces phaeofaciens JCM 4814]|uniref:NADP oxidoreductase n=1 Tax=Streptomyces phaeofaciens TaxID=68254 RepID=A0A918HRT0_9ACTN|nr:NAD(P)-binding domain-containing protein [Streptomyces phaeofaciens]GGT91618.1 NADP oxidoreductase [Streptomyces phaeofaciens]